MKMFKIFTLSFFLLLMTAMGNAQDYHVRIGFIGNSITIGSGLASPEINAYPNQFASMLQEKYGDTCIVGNFAVSGRTMLKHGDFPIWNELFFRNGWAFAPEIFVICLGTNDTKPYNWDPYGDEFFDDYMAMIDTFRVRNPFVKIFVCYPPPVIYTNYDILDSVLVHGVLPVIDSVLKKTDAMLIDFNTPLLDSASLIPDGVHPNIQGAKGMAEIVYRKFLETDIIHKVEPGLTFVNSLKSAKSLIRLGDSTVLSWTTINADSAFLDGVPVATAGSLTIKPGQTKVYTLLAKGKKSIDSIKYTQQVYVPVLTRLSISPKSSRMKAGDSLIYTVYFVDQESKYMTDSVFEVNWTIEQGDGLLVEKTNNTITFIAGTAGTAKIQAKVGDLLFQASVTIENATGLNQVKNLEKPVVFPNPAENIINVLLDTPEATALQFRLYDLGGVLKLTENFSLSKGGRHLLNFKTDNLADGLYLYEIEVAGSLFTGKITKQN